jgi:hypothetical protein
MRAFGQDVSAPAETSVRKTVSLQIKGSQGTKRFLCHETVWRD